MWHISQKTDCKFYKTGHCCTSSVYKGCTMLWSAALQHISLSGICIAFQPCTPYTICVVFNSFTAHHCVVHILTRVPIHPHSGTEKRRGGAICRQTIVLPPLTCLAQDWFGRHPLAAHSQLESTRLALYFNTVRQTCRYFQFTSRDVNIPIPFRNASVSGQTQKATGF